MASTLSALPIRLGTGTLRRPARHISVLHIARQAKPHVVNMAVPKRLFSSHPPPRSWRMCMSPTINHRPQFVAKGPPFPISNTNLVAFTIGCFVSLMIET